jgi:hypothetical protein
LAGESGFQRIIGVSYRHYARYWRAGAERIPVDNAHGFRAAPRCLRDAGRRDHPEQQKDWDSP